MIEDMNSPLGKPASATTPAPATGLITPEHLRQFRDDGFFILNRVIPPAQLAALQEACGVLIAERDAEMTAQGIEVDGITHKGRRYFLANNFTKSAACRE